MKNKERERIRKNKWRKLHPEVSARYNRKFRNLAMEFLHFLKEQEQCADCRKNFPYYVMDFDHIKGTKKKDLNKMMSSSWSAIMVELEKCEIVCSNCHRAREYRRKHDIYR